MSDVDLRASDDERQAAVDRLAAHYRAGRLDADELEERTAAANAARTRAELSALEADLPGEPVKPPGKRAGERIAGALFFSAIFWVIWLATGADGFVWPVIPTAIAVLGTLKELTDDDAMPELPRPPEPPRLP
ncbi:MAG TPA: DUF1707 domain-containing protein [Baekduia sp.]|nr:DUF1707 domain-containing protein [Baekduia sp.]